MNTILLRSANLNAGDHLISKRLSKHLDGIGIRHLLLDRKSARELGSLSDRFVSQADRDSVAVIGGGGPLVGQSLIPDKLSSEILDLCPRNKYYFYGVGLAPVISSYGSVNFRESRLHFNQASADFLREVGKYGQPWSARDPVAAYNLARFNENVANVGCPALFQSIYESNPPFLITHEPRNILFTAPARPVTQFWQLLAGIGNLFPSANLSVLLQAGLPNWRLSPRQRLNRSLSHVSDARQEFNKLSEEMDVGIIDVAGDLEEFEKVVSASNLVVGYRLHAHILSLSNGIPSFVLAEDQRTFHFQANFTSNQRLTYKSPIEDLIKEMCDNLGNKSYWAGVSEVIESLRESQYEYLIRLRNSIES